VLSMDMGSTKVITDTANDGDCGNGCLAANLQSYVSKNGGFAGVNGTYFCPITYPECSSKTNSFDFPVYNTRLGHWINGGNLSWNSRSIFYFDGSGAHYLQNANSFSGGLTAGIVNYPGLIDGGNVQIDDAQSGLSDKQKAKGTKVGIGVRGNTVMVVVATIVVDIGGRLVFTVPFLKITYATNKRAIIINIKRGAKPRLFILHCSKLKK